MVRLLAVGRHPLEHLARAVDGGAFLVPGDEQADRARDVVALGLGEIEGGCGEAGDGALHVGSAPSVKRAVLDHPGEGRIGPQALIARRHHVGMPGEADMRRPRADAGEEIVDRRRAVLAESEPPAVEAAFCQGPLQHVERAGVFRRHARAADQVFGKLNRTFARLGHGGAPCFLPICIAAWRGGSEGQMGLALKLRVVPACAERVRAEAVRPLRPPQKADLDEQPIPRWRRPRAQRRPRVHTTAPLVPSAPLWRPRSGSQRR